MLKETAEYERDTSSINFMAISAQFLLIRHQVSANYCQRALVDELGVIRTQIGTHNG
jgi:hypothetical protein